MSELIPQEPHFLTPAQDGSSPAAPQASEGSATGASSGAAEPASTEPAAAPEVWVGHHAPFKTGAEWSARELFWLFVKPRQFFRERAPRTADWFLPFLVCCVGAGLVALRLQESAAQTAFSAARAGGAKLDLGAFAWGPFWGALLIGGAIGGGIKWAVGGWWYGVRISLCGQDRFHPEYARMVMMYSELIWAIPLLLVTVYLTVTTPNMLAGSTSAALLLVVPFQLASFWYSYVGVCTSFDVNRTRAAAWFLILPAFVMCAAWIVVFVGAVVQAMAYAPK